MPSDWNSPIQRGKGKWEQYMTYVTKPPFYPYFSAHFASNHAFLCYHMTCDIRHDISNDIIAQPHHLTVILWSSCHGHTLHCHISTLLLFRYCHSLELLSWPHSSLSHSHSSPLSYGHSLELLLEFSAHLYSRHTL
jgi:hypothetical protein